MEGFCHLFSTIKNPLYYEMRFLMSVKRLTLEECFHIPTECVCTYSKNLRFKRTPSQLNLIRHKYESQSFSTLATKQGKLSLISKTGKVCKKNK